MLCRIRDTPGLDELYLSTMDTIENITPNDALYMLQGSMMSNTDTSRGNRLGLAPGELAGDLGFEVSGLHVVQHLKLLSHMTAC